MAATFVTVTNLTATTLSFAGDKGIPSVTIGHVAGHNTATITMGDLLGNSSLCTTLAAWITDGTVSITRGAVTLTAANLTAYAQGSDMNRASYDNDDDGIVDSAESVNFASITAETALAVGDSFLLYDLSAVAPRKFTVPNALNISVLTAETVLADDDAVLIYDTSVTAVRKMTVANFLARKVFQETNLQVAAADLTTTLFIAPAAGTIKGALCKAGTTAAAGENMTVDVQIGGVTCLSAVMDMTNAVGTGVVTGAINAAADDFVAGNVITIVRDYTAGGGATPMANTIVSVWANVALS